MTRPDFTRICRRGLPIVLAGFAYATAQASTDKPTITLDPPAAQAVSAQASSMHAGILAKAPANYRDLGEVNVGEVANIEALTLRFSATTKLQKISSSPDFVVEQGGNCVEGNVYTAADTCRLLVRFTPQGAGHRLGKLTITHSASLTPMFVGLGGYGNTPVVSFTPAQINTVPASVSGSTGVLNGALNLAIDGGDTLYVADTGNNLVRAMDSSGVFTTISSGGLSAPEGVIADPFGEVYFTEPAQNLLYEIYAYGSQFQLSGSTASSCTTAAPCDTSGQKVYTPGEMATDGYGRIFFVDGYYGASEFVAQSQTASYAHIDDPFTFQATTPGVIAVDTSDNLYSFWYNGGTCSISMQSFYNASNNYSTFSKVAGGKTCGFAGDGGQARNAEISTNLGQMAIDAAGNLYFTDSGNNRVRRIDYSTGIIRTIVGNGVIGSAGDGGPATSAHLNVPTGVAVDSQGQVFVISHTAGTQQNIRKVGPNGYLSFGSVPKASTLLQTVNVANTGNSALSVTKATITGANAADFTIDPNSTSCDFTTGNSLTNSQSCTVGVIFKPTASGARTANLVLLDNTVTNSNTVILAGTGSLPSPTVKITAPTAGATFTSGTTVKFAVSVTSTGTAPTGSVTFKVDGAAFGGAVTLATGSASVNLTGLTVKTHTISASYSGDANYASYSVSESITVKAAAAVASKTIASPFIRVPAAPSWQSAAIAPGLVAVPLGGSSLESGQGCEAKTDTPGSTSAETPGKPDSAQAGDCKSSESSRTDSLSTPRKESN